MSPEDIEITSFIDLPEKGYWTTTLTYTNPHGKELVTKGVARSKNKSIKFALMQLANRVGETYE